MFRSDFWVALRRSRKRHGNVWYFGESAVEYDPDGLITGLGGSWMAGVDGAKPGIIMKANPQIGDL